MKRSLRRQIRTLIPVMLQAFIFGLHCAWAPANLEYFRSKHDGLSLTEADISWIVSIMHLGRLLAPVTFICIGVQFGRKTCYIASSLIMLIGTVILFSQETLYAILIARTIIGFGSGIADIATIMYIGEVVRKDIRGVFCSVNSAIYLFGLVTLLALRIFFTFDQLLAMLLAVSILLLLSTFDFVESPYFLSMEGQTKTALIKIQWLQDLTLKQAEEELHEISQNTNVDRMTFFGLMKNFTKPEIYKSCCVVGSLGMISSLVGNTVSSYAIIIFPKSQHVSSIHFAIYFHLLLMLVSCMSSFLIDRIGRRSLLLPTFFIQSIVYGCVALLFHLQNSALLKIPHFAWIIFLLVALTNFLFQLGCTVPISVIRTEIFPSSFKDIGVSGNIIIIALTNFVSSYLFLQVTEKYGMYLNFMIFSVAGLVGALLVYFLLPETKGKSLAEIQIMLKK